MIVREIKWQFKTKKKQSPKEFDHPMVEEIFAFGTAQVALPDAFEQFETKRLDFELSKRWGKVFKKVAMKTHMIGIHLSDIPFKQHELFVLLCRVGEFDKAGYLRDYTIDHYSVKYPPIKEEDLNPKITSRKDTQGETVIFVGDYKDLQKLEEETKAR